jgi:NPCBM/NEW2 domain
VIRAACNLVFLRNTVTTTLLSLVALIALATPPEVTLRPLVGESWHGRLQAISATTVQVETSSGPRELAAGQVMWLDFPAGSTASKPTLWIELLDGSRLAAVAYAAADGKARITLATDQSIDVATRAIHWVRFYQQTPELAIQWRQIASSMATGDTLVIRKSSTRTIEQGESEPRTVTEQALDQLEGTVLEVTPDSVRFELDGEKVNVRRDKLEGLIYYQPHKREFAAPRCRLTDVAGSTWLLRELALAGDRLTASTLGGLPLELQLASVAKIDFSVGNVAFLSDLEADSGGGELTLSLQPAAMTHKFSRVFQLRAAPPLGADAFRMGGERYENGLSVHSPTKLVYRVPAGFRKFYAVAGIDDTMLAPGRFTLLILADGKEVARHAFSDEQRKAVSVGLEVSQVRRISIVLESGDGQDIGDQLNLCEARFTK